jgi:Carboxypeptidase regulatory-like domain
MMKYRQIAMNLTGVEICVVNNLSKQRPPEFTPMSQLPLYLRRAATGLKFALIAMILGSAITVVFAAVTGSISGTARDTQGAVVPGATVTLRNTQTGVVQTARTDSAGFYSFPSLPLGHYDVTFDKSGFGNYEEADVVIDVDTARRVDATLKVGANQQKVTVTATQAQVDTVSAQMGEVIGAKEITNMPLNGRAYTDLLALQPGVVPINVQMYGSLQPSSDLNNGLLSMSGAQDVHSGFMVNGANTFEGAGGGTFLVPTLDSISQFRIITNNAGAEYGGYAGGLVNVVTKSGTNQFHGDAYEFFRNGDLNGKGFFDTSVPNLNQNQFGGTVGGPILRDKVFFFVDYQGTRDTSGVSARVTVPSAADLTGDLSDREGNFLQNAKSVSGPYFASLLTTRLGYNVTAGEPYYTADCTSNTQCVFPNAFIPPTAWSPVSANVLGLLPAANQVNPDTGIENIWNSNAFSSTLTDNKGGVKVDANTRFGLLSGYYHYDPWSTSQPFGGSSSVPGFPSNSEGKAQLWVFSITTTINPTTVNVFTASYTRNKNIQGLSPSTGPTLASLGFADPSNGGIYQLAPPAYQNWPGISLNTFGVGAPISVVSQFNNTYEFQDDFTKIIGSHSLKFGAEYHWDQVDLSHPNNGSNGGFGFNGQETGDDLADLLVGAPDYFFQGSPAGLNLRTFYAGIYGEDSWRATQNLTVNYGVRWEVNPFWREEHNLNPVVLLGKQSTQFPTAPTGYLFPGDAGVPVHMSDINWHDFGPRVSLAYTPDQGRTSFRAGYGMYFTNVEGYNTFNFASAPYSLFYEAPVPALFAQPFIDRATGNVRIQPFPLPPVTDDQNLDWSRFEPIGGKRNPLIHSPSPYEEHIDVSFERALSSNTVFTLSYVGTFGHHLTVNADNNPGDPALCLSVSQATQVTDGITCGPGGENGVYHPVGGGVIDSTRGPFGPNFQGNGYQLNIGNSAYNALESTLRHTSERLSILLSYTWSKAIDNGSGFGDQVFLYGDHNHFRNISAFDVPNNFVASYTYELPFDLLFKKNNRLTRGWKISGITSFVNGVPVQILEPDDQSLMGNTGNSPFFGSTDAPELAQGNIMGDHNPRHGKPWFNTSLFSQEVLGTQGNSPRRFFHGPGVNNTDLALLKDLQLTSTTSLEFRAEFFNVFNHAQFYGLNSVDGNFNDGPGNFGVIFGDNGGRIGQLAVKFNF